MGYDVAYIIMCSRDQEIDLFTNFFFPELRPDSRNLQNLSPLKIMPYMVIM